MTTPSYISSNPRYIVGEDQRSIVLCDGDKPIAIMLENLTENHATAFTLHLNLAVQLGACMAFKEQVKELGL